MKIFQIGQQIYRYATDTWIQAEKMLAEELGVSVWEIASLNAVRYEL